MIIVGPDRRHYHERLFPSLPAIDSHNVVGDAESLHFNLEFPDLTRVRCNEAEFADVKLLHLLEVFEQSYHNIDFSLVEVWVTNLLFIFVAVDEQEWVYRHEYTTAIFFVIRFDLIFIEKIVRYSEEIRMHAIWLFKHHKVWETSFYQSWKHLIKNWCASSEDRPQLVLISYQDNFFCIENCFQSFDFMSLSGFIYDDSIEILLLYKFSFGGFACCNNDLHFIEDLLYNLIFNEHKVIELLFSKIAYAVIEISQKRPFFDILNIFVPRWILLDLALSAKVAIRRLYLFVIIEIRYFFMIDVINVSEVF